MSDSKGSIIKPIHDIIIKSRENIIINGIKDIIDFDDQEVNLSTVCGNLCIEGENIHINTLNVQSGEIAIFGKINSLYYIDSTETGRKTFLSKIFK